MRNVLVAMRLLTPLGVALRVLVSILLGGVIGLERGLKNRPAGLRTYMLVSLGACMVMMINQYTYQAYHSGDLVRMGAQVISGIGFLGAGTIIVTSRNQIKGLTTAAGLWAAACVGLAVGIGLYEVAVVGGSVIFLVLTALHECDFRLKSTRKVADAYIELEEKSLLGDFLRYSRMNEIETSNLQLEYDATLATHTVGFIVTLKWTKKYQPGEVMTLLSQMQGVCCVEEL